MALSDAKSDVDDRVRDLAAAERELEKADFDLRYKTHEAKIVNKAAVAKRTEVCKHNVALPQCPASTPCFNALPYCPALLSGPITLPCPKALLCQSS